MFLLGVFLCRRFVPSVRYEGGIRAPTASRTAPTAARRTALPAGGKKCLSTYRGCKVSKRINVITFSLRVSHEEQRMRYFNVVSAAGPFRPMPYCGVLFTSLPSQKSRFLSFVLRMPALRVPETRCCHAGLSEGQTAQLCAKVCRPRAVLHRCALTAALLYHLLT